MTESLDPIADHLEWCRVKGLANRTKEDREDVLRRADRALPMGLAYANRQELRAWLANDRWTDATRQTYQGHLTAFYAQALDDGLIDDNPMVGIPKPRTRKGRPRPLSEEQLRVALTESIYPYRLCAVIAYGSGMRCCEIAGLTREDITETRDGDSVGWWAYLRYSKGGETDMTPVTAEVWEAVRDFPRGSNLVEHAGGIADPRWISRRSAEYWRRSLGLQGVTMHRFRHSFAKRLRANGADVWAVKAALRHKSVTSTEIYLGATKEECAQRVRTLPTFQPPAAA